MKNVVAVCEASADVQVLQVEPFDLFGCLSLGRTLAKTSGVVKSWLVLIWTTLGVLVVAILGL